MVWERWVVRVIVQGEKKQNKETTVYLSSVWGNLNVYPSLLLTIGRMIVWPALIQTAVSVLLAPLALCIHEAKKRKKEIQLGPRPIQNGRQSSADWEQCEMTNGGGACGAGGALVKITRSSFPPFFPYAATCDEESPSVLRQSQVKW